MSHIDTDQAEPLSLTIQRTTDLTGLSRSEVYRRLISGDLRAVKKGRQTLILYESVKRLIESLPPAKFGAAPIKHKTSLDDLDVEPKECGVIAMEKIDLVALGLDGGKGVDLFAKGKRPRRSHIFDRDDHDFYVEPPWCSERLFAVEPFAGLIWDPAAGSGTIPRAARAADDHRCHREKSSPEARSQVAARRIFVGSCSIALTAARRQCGGCTKMIRNCRLQSKNKTQNALGTRF